MEYDIGFVISRPPPAGSPFQKNFIINDENERFKQRLKKSGVLNKITKMLASLKKNEKQDPIELFTREKEIQNLRNQLKEKDKEIERLKLEVANLSWNT